MRAFMSSSRVANLSNMPIMRPSKLDPGEEDITTRTTREKQEG